MQAGCRLRAVLGYEEAECSVHFLEYYRKYYNIFARIISYEHVFMTGYFKKNIQDDFKLNVLFKLNVRGSVHHSTIHKEKSNKVQQCINILLFHIYMKLNMLRATHRPSSGT